METLLAGCLDSETKEEIKLSFAHQLGAKRQGRRANEDRNILLGFTEGTTRALVLDMPWDMPRLNVERQTLTFFQICAQ